MFQNVIWPDMIQWLQQQLDSLAADEAPAPSALPPPEFPALQFLSQQLNLTAFDQKVLLLGTAVEVAPELSRLYAQAQGHEMMTYPTLGLALKLFADASWDAIAPEQPLRYWRLVRIEQSAGRPLTTSPLQIDERIINLLIGGTNRLDYRLRPFLLPLVNDHHPIALAPSQQAAVAQASAHIEQTNGNRWPLLQLVGSDSVSKQLVTHQLANHYQLNLYSLPVPLLPRSPQELTEFARLWHRESLLLPLALYLDGQELESEGGQQEYAARLRHFLSQSNGLFLLDTREVRHDLGQKDEVIVINKPEPGEQMDAWRAQLPPNTPASISARLAAQFNLNLPTIHQIAQTTAAADADLSAQLWQACLNHARPRLDTLAQRLVPKATWADIVLPEDQLLLLRHLGDQVHNRSTVYEEWGFRRRSSRGLGITVLFAGESGTGKTMAAEVLANHLQLDLYRIDLSSVVSKYIGETEKNLRKLFDAAEDGGALLFFDEADALFGKRSEVRDSHDRYANIETNYLLQRLEAYQGLAILATNMKSGLDDAFARRLRFSLTFRKPDRAYRRQIWQKIFPPQTPLANLDYDYLAQTFELTGGSIYN
ncbi:MAG: ATP-binding protein, partial [Ardenticatenaceae bacterium]|nr:ATP-binding protein [Ardenticatenaceae bacterium]